MKISRLLLPDLLRSMKFRPFKRLVWAGVKNGELMRRASEVCDVFITLDRNLEYQQNVKSLSFGVVVLVARSSRVSDLSPLVPGLLQAIGNAIAGNVQKVSL